MVERKELNRVINLFEMTRQLCCGEVHFGKLAKIN